MIELATHHMYDLIFFEFKMTPEELLAIIDSTKWKELGHGSYNKAYVSEKPLTISGYTGLWVLKKPLPVIHKISLLMNNKTRAVRKWNLLNPLFPAIECEDGWLAPYIGDVEASDQQVANKLIDIYLRTRIILADACSKSNFLMHLGEVVCIDVDLSLRRGSVASDEFTLSVLHTESLNFFKYWSERGKYLTVSIIRTLIYLEKYIDEADIKDSYISFKVLGKLNVLREKNAVLSAAVIEKFIEIINLDDKSSISTSAFFELIKVGGISAPYVKGSKHAIHVAAEFGLLFLVKLLIKNNPELLNVTDIHNQTPLIYAVAKRRNHIVEELIKNGAELNIPTQLMPDNVHYIKLHNCTPLDIAIKSNFEDTIIILRAAGAITNWHKDVSGVVSRSELSKSSSIAELSIFAERPSEVKRPRLTSPSLFQAETKNSSISGLSSVI